MKRTMIDTYAHCMTTLRKNKKLGAAGYDHVEMHPTTLEEIINYQKIVFNMEPSFNKSDLSYKKRTYVRSPDNMYTLTLFRNTEKN